MKITITMCEAEHEGDMIAFTVEFNGEVVYWKEAIGPRAWTQARAEQAALVGAMAHERRPIQLASAMPPA